MTPNLFSPLTCIYLKAQLYSTARVCVIKEVLTDLLKLLFIICLDGQHDWQRLATHVVEDVEHERWLVGQNTDTRRDAINVVVSYWLSTTTARHWLIHSNHARDCSCRICLRWTDIWTNIEWILHSQFVIKSHNRKNLKTQTFKQSINSNSAYTLICSNQYAAQCTGHMGDVPSKALEWCKKRSPLNQSLHSFIHSLLTCTTGNSCCQMLTSVSRVDDSRRLLHSRRG